jgi:uncharacterized membrane protein YbhN (UPF0104 family)
MLNEKEKNILLHYEKGLKTSKWKYIIINGLVWGILVLLVMSLIEYFFQKKTLEEQWKDGLLIRIIIMPFAGLLYGWFMRRTMERKHSELKQKENFLN